MNKYGQENFYIEALEENIPCEMLDEKEIKYIEEFDSFHNGYNSTNGGDTKTIYKIEDINDIVSRLQNGELVKDIAKSYGVNPCTITRTLGAYGIVPRNIQVIKTKKYLRTLPREEIVELYRRGMSHIKIAETLHINQRSVSRVIKEFGLNHRNLIDYNSLDIELIYKDIIQWEQGNIKKKDILEKYKINNHSIKIIKRMIEKNKQ